MEDKELIRLLTAQLKISRYKLKQAIATLKDISIATVEEEPYAALFYIKINADLMAHTIKEGISDKLNMDKIESLLLSASAQEEE